MTFRDALSTKIKYAYLHITARQAHWILWVIIQLFEKLALQMVAIKEKPQTAKSRASSMVELSETTNYRPYGYSHLLHTVCVCVCVYVCEKNFTSSFLQTSEDVLFLHGDHVTHVTKKREAFRLIIDQLHTRTHLYAYAHVHTRTPLKSDMASTKMRVSCSHWHCFAHLRKKDRLEAHPYIHTSISSLPDFALDNSFTAR